MTQRRLSDVLLCCHVAFTATTMMVMMPTTRHLTAAAFNTAAAVRRSRRFAASMSAAAASSSSDAPPPELSSSSSSTHQLESSSSSSRPFFAIYYNDVYKVKLPPNHRFPMEKYRKVRERVQRGLALRRQTSTSVSPSPSSANHDSSSQNARMRVDCELRVSPLASVGELATTHSRDYIQRFLTGDQTPGEIRNVGFPWSTAGVQRAQSSVGGTVAAAVAVCAEREQQQQQQRREPKTLCWGAHIAGGTHHAFYDRGEGFCVFSDIAVAANVVLERFPTVRRILILDLDVHQGNGNAVLFQNRPEVFTFSLHCSSNYFSEKEESDLDIELPSDCNDETYLLTLRHWLKQIQQNAGAFDLVFFQAGVDILEHDRLGRMKITAQGIRRRNQLVYDFVARDLQLPLVITMGGGYPRNRDQWEPILDAHANVYLQAYDYLSEQCMSELKEEAALMESSL